VYNVIATTAGPLALPVFITVGFKRAVRTHWYIFYIRGRTRMIRNDGVRKTFLKKKIPRKPAGAHVNGIARKKGLVFVYC
jgi:hypothetical protein